MRDEDPAYGVFRDPEEYQYYKNMFFNLTDIMSEVGFSQEVSTNDVKLCLPESLVYNHYSEFLKRGAIWSELYAYFCLV